jgi:hypothetical protein
VDALEQILNQKGSTNQQFWGSPTVNMKNEKKTPEKRCGGLNNCNDKILNEGE